MEKHIFANPELCTGCNRCVYVCSAVKEGLFQPSKARIHINNFPLRGYSVPSVCFQCPRPDCMAACPEGAITKNDDGIVLVDAEKCNGCGGDPACVKECEPKAIVFAEGNKKMRKINGLQMKQRIKTGSPSEKRHQVGVNLMALARG